MALRFRRIRAFDRMRMEGMPNMCAKDVRLDVRKHVIMPHPGDTT